MEGYERELLEEVRTGKVELQALRERIRQLEALLDTVRGHERREEGKRIRRELLEEFGEPGPVEWRHLMKALDRMIDICANVPHNGPNASD